MKLNSDLEVVLSNIEKIDFSKINRKLQHDEPKRWSDGVLKVTERSYRQFLALNVLYASETLAVNRLIDDYWHAHILDTKKYAEDCDTIFGKMLHHYPYFGLPGEPDEGENVQAFAVTREIWRDAFGTDLVSGLGKKSRLTLDKVLRGLDRASDGPDAGPQGCKNGQHCQKVIAPIEIDVAAPIVAVDVMRLDG